MATPKSLRKAEAQAEFAALGLDAAVVAAYGLILPKPILDAPRLGCFNVHASLLPRWRGAAPIQRAILAGDTESGVTIMKMDEGLDTGAMLLAERVAIGPEMNAGVLHDALAAMGARLIVRSLAAVEAGRAVATPQPGDGVTYAAKIDKAEALLDWTRPAVELHRIVRAFAPAPGAWFEQGGERVRVLAARIEVDHGAPGTVLDDRFLVACGDGALRLLTVQRAGRAALPAVEFLRGNPVPAGARRRGRAMTRFKITIEYDGTGLAGWQRQDNGPSVQAALEAAAAKLAGQPVEVTGAGRTDAGVHASGQAAHLDIERSWGQTPCATGSISGCARAARTRSSCWQPRRVTEFHARFSAIQRRYRYRILSRRFRRRSIASGSGGCRSPSTPSG